MASSSCILFDFYRATPSKEHHRLECTAGASVAMMMQFRQMLSEELTMQKNAGSSTDDGMTAYITQTFLGNF